MILNVEHNLPETEDDDINQPLIPSILQNAGILFALNDDASNTRYRNLAFNADIATAYRLTKEEALSAIAFKCCQTIRHSRQSRLFRA
ncbi:MAG: hypothetical protein KIT80_06035 [Chitinophagaceae bacterium]|nr:hypothetical protein [Chitinophagaceae bacterium]MCW5926453.1 hypothetical protein [Chitinophagaceae bacterium]